jgi:hypothetical protein
VWNQTLVGTVCFNSDVGTVCAVRTSSFETMNDEPEGERRVETMGKEWEVEEVLTNVEPMEPPEWLVSDSVRAFRDDPQPCSVDETFGEVLEKRAKVVRSQWNRVVNLLNGEGKGTGYERLLALRENLEERREEIASTLDKWIDRRDYLKELEEAYLSELYAHSEQDLPPQIDSPVVETSLDRGEGEGVLLKVRMTVPNTPDSKDSTQDLPPLADCPVAETFLDFEEHGNLLERPTLKEGWTIKVDRADSDEPACRENTKVLYRPSEEKLDELDIEPEHVYSLRSQIGTDPSITWEKVLHDIRGVREMVSHEGARYQRTADLLDFRLRLVKNVIHRFETFGSVEGMTEKEARGIAESQLPDVLNGRPKAREYAEEIVEKYREAPFSLPEKMGEFKEVWIDSNGTSKVTRLQAEIREAGLSDLWENGNPDSFCMLLEQLVEAHYADQDSNMF